MDGATRYRRALATIGLFTLIAGDFWRYLLSWWGWGAIAAILVALCAIELARARPDLRRLPPGLAIFLALAAASIVWSAYPGSTALGVLATLATTVFAVFLALLVPWHDAVDALAAAGKAVLGASLLFELVVALVIRRPVLPLWVDYSHLDEIPRAFYWSRELLLEGGRIQGIVGNANLLAMAAFLALTVFAARWWDHRGSRISNAVWTAVALLVLVLTGSTTIVLAVLVTAIVVSAALLARRLRHRERVLLAGGTFAALLGAGALAVVLREPLLELVGRSPDLTNRLDIWAAVWSLIAERPVQGWGWVGYWPPWEDLFHDLVVIRGVTYLQAHNAWLDVALQLGILGVLALGALAVTGVVRSWRLALAGPGALAVAPLALLVGVLVQSLAESRLLIEIGWTVLVLATVGIRASTPAAEPRSDR